MKTKKYLGRAFIYLMLALIYLPILVLIVYSFTATKTIGGEWSGFTFPCMRRSFPIPK